MPSHPRHVSSRGPLRAVGAPRPAKARARKRLRRLVAVVLIVLLAAGAAIGVIAAYQIAASPSTGQLTLPPTDASATPEPAPTNPATPVEEQVAGQTVYRVAPDGDALGVAVLLPDVGENGQSLITNPAATTLRAAGWAVVAADFGGETWGSPASSDLLAGLRSWTGTQWPGLPVAYVASGMGATTAVTAMVRQPATAASCVYTVAPVTDLVAAVGADGGLAARISAAWGRTPTPDENPILAVPALPTDTTYRVVTPEAPAERVEDATAFASALSSSAHAVTTTTVASPSWPALGADLSTFAEGCLS